MGDKKSALEQVAYDALKLVLGASEESDLCPHCAIEETVRLLLANYCANYGEPALYTMMAEAYGVAVAHTDALKDPKPEYQH